MEKILNVGKTYKYEIIGFISLCIVYLCFHIYSKQEKNKNNKNDKLVINNDNFNNKKELRILISEIRKMSSGMKELLELNKKINPKDNYFNFRDQYFTKDIEKIRILIDTKSMTSHNSDEHLNTSQYIVLFGVDKSNPTSNTISFGERLDNVIGIRLTRATIPDTLYTVTPSNKHFVFTFGETEYHGELIEGSYSFQALGNEFERVLNELVGENTFTINSSISSFKYTLNYENGGPLVFNWSNSDPGFYKLIGGSYIVGIKGDTIIETIELDDTPYTFRNTIDHSIHFVDIVIPEIPSIATKITSNGYNIVDRIPLTGIRGNLVTYIPLEEGTPWTQNYFYPINLNQLSINLYDDTTSNLLRNNNNDHVLEFEVAMLKNTKLLK